MKALARIVVTLTACLTSLLHAPLAAAQDHDKRPDGVREFMTYHLGRWESTTTHFNFDGSVKKDVGGYGEKVLVDGQVNLHYSYLADGSVNTALRFYSPGEDKVYMIDVTAKGTWWVLSGKRGEDILYSAQKELPDGRKMIFKATHTNIRPDAFDAIFELSDDGGTTWRKTSHSEYRKIGDGVAASAGDTTTLRGEFVWTGAGENGSGKLESTFTPAGRDRWDVSFRFEWRDAPHVYTGNATGSLSEGPLEGQVKNDDKSRNFTFTGTFADGVFHGTHTEVGRGRPDRIEQTGTMTLRR